nr:hypothetical protein [Candidatus Phycosocius bacilliformis]
MKRIGHLQSSSRNQVCPLSKDGLVEFKDLHSVEETLVILQQEAVSDAQWPRQAFSYDEMGYGKFVIGRCCDLQQDRLVES